MTSLLLDSNGPCRTRNVGTMIRVQEEGFIRCTKNQSELAIVLALGVNDTNRWFTRPLIVVDKL